MIQKPQAPWTLKIVSGYLLVIAGIFFALPIFMFFISLQRESWGVLAMAIYTVIPAFILCIIYSLCASMLMIGKKFGWFLTLFLLVPLNFLFGLIAIVFVIGTVLNSVTDSDLGNKLTSNIGYFAWAQVFISLFIIFVLIKDRKYFFRKSEIVVSQAEIK